MKTTIELPDELLTKAKATAAMRRTTLKAMILHALEREIDFPEGANSNEEMYELNEHGFPVIKRNKNDKQVTSEHVYQMMEDLGI